MSGRGFGFQKWDKVWSGGGGGGGGRWRRRHSRLRVSKPRSHAHTPLFLAAPKKNTIEDKTPPTRFRGDKPPSPSLRKHARRQRHKERVPPQGHQAGARIAARAAPQQALVEEDVVEAVWVVWGGEGVSASKKGAWTRLAAFGGSQTHSLNHFLNSPVQVAPCDRPIPRRRRRERARKSARTQRARAVCTGRRRRPQSWVGRRRRCKGWCRAWFGEGRRGGGAGRRGSNARARRWSKLGAHTRPPPRQLFPLFSLTVSTDTRPQTRTSRAPSAGRPR